MNKNDILLELYELAHKHCEMARKKQIEKDIEYYIQELHNTISEFDKWLLGEQMMFYRGSDDEILIRYKETLYKWQTITSYYKFKENQKKLKKNKKEKFNEN